MIVRLTGVGKSFPTEAGLLPALEGVSFSVDRGSTVSLVGPSGCGKTTLLKLIAGIETPSAGRLDFVGAGSGRTPVALVFQQDGLLPWKRVEDNVAFGLQMQGVARAERRARAREALARLGLLAFARHFPHQLSVGMQQRVALLRALLMEPALLLLDEPFAALDAQMRRVLQDELLREQARTGTTLVHVTHDVEEALLLADVVLVMSGRPGRVVEAVRVPLGRPRSRAALRQPELEALRHRIWAHIEAEVRSALGLA